VGGVNQNLSTANKIYHGVQTIRKFGPESAGTELWYGDCGIRYLNVLDYLAGPRQPRITRLAASDPTPSVEIAYQGWTFPKGGVAFVWVLEGELDATKSDQR